MFSRKTYGSQRQTKGKSHQRGEKTRKRYWFTRISNRPFHRNDQKTHYSSQEKRQGFPFSTRASQDDFQKKETDGLFGKNQRKRIQETDQKVGT